MKIGLLSGAFSSDKKWNELRKKIPSGQQAFHIPYNPLIDLHDTVESIEFDLNKAGHDHGDIMLIGHSLGGVIAAALSSRVHNVVRTVTVASPFGGIEGAVMMDMFT